VGADDAAAVVGKGRGGVVVVGVVGVPCAWQSSAKGRRKDRVGGGIVVSISGGTGLATIIEDCNGGADWEDERASSRENEEHEIVQKCQKNEQKEHTDISNSRYIS